MAIQQQIDSDIKTAMLAGDKTKTETLRTVKSALLNEAIAAGARESGLSDEQAQKILAKEAKKRQEAADLYKQGGSPERAEAELAEKAVIDGYLPEQASEADIKAAVEAEIGKLDNPGPQNMGQVIGAVRVQLGAGADGAVIARLVKEALAK
ncbi:MAG TPA: GatB/YqeY domain-containing protein [Candidatus Nitrosopolaris sp.]|nr:GatB/YqeY domain-containing protein [Candidatus Nitrosopolaris sp.]